MTATRSVSPSLRLVPSIGVALALFAYGNVALCAQQCDVEAAVLQGQKAAMQAGFDRSNQALTSMQGSPSNDDYGKAQNLRDTAQGCLFDAAGTMGTLVKSGDLGSNFTSTILQDITRYLKEGACLYGASSVPHDANIVTHATPNGFEDIFSYVPGGLSALIDQYFPGGLNGFSKLSPGGVTDLALIAQGGIHSIVAGSVPGGVTGAIGQMIDSRPNGLSEFLSEVGGEGTIIQNLPPSVVAQIPRDPMNQNTLLIDQYPGGIRGLINQLPDSGADKVVSTMPGQYNTLVDRVPQATQRNVVNAIANQTPGGMRTIVASVPDGEQKVVDAAGGVQTILNRYAGTATSYGL